MIQGKAMKLAGLKKEIKEAREGYEAAIKEGVKANNKRQGCHDKAVSFLLRIQALKETIIDLV